MPRPIEVDRETAFEIAERIFWRQGYCAASMQDLLDGMAMSRSSFYSAFGSKRKLFESVLDSQLATAIKTTAEINEQQRGLDALREFLDRTMLALPTEDRIRGCPFVNSVLELEGVDEQLHERATKSLGYLRHALKLWLTQARELKQVAATIPLDALIDIAELSIKGLRVAAREGAGSTALKQRVDSLIDVLSLGAQG